MGISNSRAAENRRKILAGIRANGTTGDVFYVDSGANSSADTAGHGKTPTVAFATVDFAIGEATANQGDVIILMAGHAEAVPNATTFLMDKAGISVVGLGIGSLRPTFTFSATGSSVVFSTADCAIENCIFVAATADNTIGVDFAATDCQLSDCEFRQGSSIETLAAVDIGGSGANAADGAIVRGCHFTSTTVGSASAILISQVTDRILIQDCWIYGQYAEACIDSSSVHTLCRVENCTLTNLTTAQHGLQFDTTATGTLVGVNVATDIALVGGLDPGSCRSFHCYACDNVDVGGAITPTENN